MTGRTGIIAACIAIASLGLWLVCGRSVVKEAVYPVENGCSWFSRTVVFRVKAFFRSGELAAENRSLRLENNALRMLRGDLQRALSENAHLKALLKLDGPNPALETNRWLCASVLGRDGAGGVHGLLRVGRGSSDGVTTNAAVAVPDGLVGRVEQVSPHTADIRLITSPNVKVACEIETADPAFGPIRGILEGGGSHAVHAESGAVFLYVLNPLRVRHLQRRPQLSAHAKIITSGLGGVFPRGLTVGFLIEDQNVDETTLEREGDVEPAVDFSALKYVFIRREN